MRPDEVIQTERRAAETMSETSEGTATSSISGKSGFESREELRDLAAVLGIANPEDLHQDRFRVDRRKLEQMLQGDNDMPKAADTFFHSCISSVSNENLKRYNCVGGLGEILCRHNLMTLP
uniref:BICC1 first type I KH domain-containing protein n=1 Tax=Vespula pensylvanica TaxID=30213 RepID=A0A834KZH8_VESPE|nr:hypothetical protein H0235_012907 [Vespula pensylvanica]